MTQLAMLPARQAEADWTIFRACVGLPLIAAACLLVTGCGTKTYTKINFAWTSDHRLAPHERFLTVNASPQSTVDALAKWARDRGGDIRERDERTYPYIFRLQPDADTSFRALQTIVQTEWAAYDANRFRDWPAGEWEKLKTLAAGQVAKVQANSSGRRLVVKMNHRVGTLNYAEAVGSTPSMMYMPGYTAYQSAGRGMKAITVPGTIVSMPVPKYESRTKTNAFYSVIQFVVFTDQGQTRVYAVGVPVEQSSSSPAAYGKTIGYAWWAQVTGREEAAAIKDAYAFISGLDRAGKLEELGSPRPPPR